MPILPVLLWTDALIFILLAATIALALYASRREPLRDSWRQIRRRPVAMAALVVLLAYVAIGLVDSVHFKRRLPTTEPGAESTHKQAAQYSPEVVSLLDVLTDRLRKSVERTYSAPLAAHAYSRETVEMPDGTQARVFPRLRYGGAHLAHPESERKRDILATALWGGLFGLGAAVVLGLHFILLLSRRHDATVEETGRKVLAGKSDTAWRATLGTIALLFMVAGIAVALSLKYHLLGTDKVGQDVFYLSLKAIRTGLVIGTVTTLVMLPFAVLLGIAAGYFRGWVDDAIQYIYTTLSSVPGVLLIAAAVLILQVYMDQNADAFTSVTQRADVRLLFLCIILGVTGWIGLCRLLRGETLKLREMDYVQAATALGVGSWRIIVRHILPNVMHIVLISVVLDFSGLVLAEAVLSYVGVGVDPAMISWGNMINSARMEMAREPVVWWSLAAAFIFMFGLVLSANLFSDAVRDALDPRLRSR
ncbi:MAG TPA: ABC transporter permease [Candidatus Manganitrophaceae bacterium]|nr:ABC transporter permease [Candidatus Manganitrophaceae bacterium]